MDDKAERFARLAEEWETLWAHQRTDTRKWRRKYFAAQAEVARLQEENERLRALLEQDENINHSIILGLRGRATRALAKIEAARDRLRSGTIDDDTLSLLGQARAALREEAEDGNGDL